MSATNKHISQTGSEKSPTTTHDQGFIGLTLTSWASSPEKATQAFVSPEVGNRFCLTRVFSVLKIISTFYIQVLLFSRSFVC
jgi:hypothetical protein